MVKKKGGRGRGGGNSNEGGPSQPPQQQQAPQQAPQQSQGRGQGRGHAFGRGRGQQQSPREGGGDLHEAFPSLSVQESPPSQQQQAAQPQQQQAPPPQQQQQAPPPQQQQQAPPPQQQQPKQQQQQQASPRQQQQQSPPTAPSTLSFVRRKTSGTQGRRTRVDTNHMALSIKTSQEVIHYDVLLIPDKPKRLLRPAVNEFVRQTCKGRNPAFDGRKNLYSCGLLPFGTEKTLMVNVQNPERNNVEEYEVTLKAVNRINFSSFQQYLSSTDRTHVPQDALQAVDVVMRQAATARFTQVGRSFFSPPEGQTLDLGNGLELWVGVFQSAILGWKPFLNIDVAHKGFPRPQSVIDLICELNNMNPASLQQGINPFQVVELQKFLRGLKVDYQVPGYPNTKRTYRVNGCKDSANQLSFNTQDDGSGETMTVQTYFRREKNIELQYPKLPCLHVGSVARNIYIPVEFCTVMKGQVIIKKMDEKQTSNMIKYAATPAYVRKKKIMDAFAKLGLNRDPCMREFGITVSERMEQVDARVLNAPMLAYKNNASVKPMRGEWRQNQAQFLISSTLRTWAVMNLEKYTKKPDIDNFTRLLQQHGKNAGMDVAAVSAVVDANSRNKRDIQEKLSRFVNFDIVFVIVPDKGDTYSTVKQIAELEYGILTQCIRFTTLSRRMNAATACNILLKVNSKLNGINHSLHEDSKPPCFKTPVMLMGADVTHPSPDSKDQPSIAAVTASHDPKAFMYNIEWRLQPPRMEIIEDLENITIKQLKFFRDKTKYQPQRIIFYRDGVSDGQFAEVLAKELSAIRRACQRLNANYKPAITFLVVQKRHHTRFFPTNPADEDGRNKNVPPGLVVDQTITHPRDMDFYLVSHQSIQGTSRPTKYHMLHDDANMSEDEVEQLTYYLCHLFSRCNRSVSYPAPTYYAHLAAFRAKAYLEGQSININHLPMEQQRRVIKEKIMQGSPMFFV